MIYLSRLILNPRSRQVQSELARPYELHRTLMKGFPDGVRREKANLLYRLENHSPTRSLILLAQSTIKPDWTPLLSAGRGKYLLVPPQTKQLSLHLLEGRVLRFRLRANPTRRLSTGKGNKAGKRVQLFREEEQWEWLQRRSQAGGFRVMDVRITSEGNLNDRRRHLKIYQVRFDGILQIIDADAFEQTLRKGIGPAKAFGCGLLSLAPA